MNKQNRGDAPKPEAVTFVTGSPLSAVKRQEGFEQDNIKSGNLRDHNGKTVNDAGFMATKHHTGLSYGGAQAGAIMGGGYSPDPTAAIPTPTPGPRGFNR